MHTNVSIDESPPELAELLFALRIPAKVFPVLADRNVGVNGNGMHTNVSISENGKNLCWDPKGEEKLSKFGWAFVDRVLTHANDICLLLNASVNSYRRLDPHFEAPNQIKASPVDRGSMIRIPIGNEKSMRVEVRSVAPDANPYLVK